MLKIPTEDQTNQKLFLMHLQNRLELFHIKEGRPAFSDNLELEGEYIRSARKKNQGFNLICVFIALDQNALAYPRNFFRHYKKLFPSVPK